MVLTLAFNVLLAAAAAPSHPQRAGRDSPCHHAMVQLCNDTAGTGALCVRCEASHQTALSTAGCGTDRSNPLGKLYRFCHDSPAPSPSPPHGTADCPNGPDHPCREPATPTLSSGFVSSNLFWPGEQDALGRVYTCTYCPMVTLVNNTRLVAVGGCVPSGCPGCNGIHVSGLDATRFNSSAACGLTCVKHSDDGGKTWSQIRRLSGRGGGGMIAHDRTTSDVLLQFTDRMPPDNHTRFPGHVVQVRSTDMGESWGDPASVSNQLGPLFSPPVAGGRGGLSVGPGHGIQLSATNKYHPNRIIFGGHHGAYQYDCVWYSDDGGKTYELSRNATGGPLQIWGQDEIALAETPDGGVITSTRNEDYHRGYPGGSDHSDCDCRGVSRSTDGGSSFSKSVPEPALIGPVCQATMLSVAAAGGSGSGRAIFHANPGHGTDKESKSPPNGRASGTVRRSDDGGRTWNHSVVLNGKDAYSYSCLTEVPQPGFVGLAFETVLPGSDINADASANNIVFTLIPRNLSAP